MVQESPTLQNDFIFLIQTKNKHLKRLLSGSVKEENVRVESIEKFEDFNSLQPAGQVISFVIGSDVEDPIRYAQQFHTLNKNAKIVLLSKSETHTRALKEAIKFSPFIGFEVFFLEERKEAKLETRLNEILKKSLQAEKYRTMIAESNALISQADSPQKTGINQQFINKLMDIAPIGIAIVGRSGEVLGWNKKAARIFNRNERQVLGTRLSGLFENGEGKRLEDYFRERFKNEEESLHEPLLLERTSQDTSKQVLTFISAPFTYSGGTEHALILTIKDETQRVQAENELQEINRTLEKRVEERTASLLTYQKQLRSLASRLSKAEELERHRLASELHNNLGQMLVLLKMKISLLQKIEVTGKTASYIQDIKEEADNALSYSRSLMSDLKPPPSIDRESILESMEWLADQMAKHDLRVTIEDDEQPKPAEDEIRITLVQCVRELLFNIIKHADVKEARIILSRLEQEIEIVVADQGKGFEVNTGRLSSEDGGFGLFNISERIDLLGGSMEIESVPGQGTRVILHAPVIEKTREKQAFEEEEPGVQSEPVSKSNKIKVLLVDDHKMMRDGLRKIVNEEDDLIVIAEASNGEEALKIAEKMSPDIVVMDVNMPVMDGISATQKLTEMMPGVRVIGLSFHDHPKVAENMRSAGASAYLSKNDAFETLSATIRSEASLSGR